MVPASVLMREFGRIFEALNLEVNVEKKKVMVMENFFYTLTED